MRGDLRGTRIFLETKVMAWFTKEITKLEFIERTKSYFEENSQENKKESHIFG